jgi:hypothetical protein
MLVAKYEIPNPNAAKKDPKIATNLKPNLLAKALTKGPAKIK